MKFTADTLSQRLTDLRFQMNPDPPAEIFPPEFFDYNVADIDPAGGSTPRSVNYCATGLAVAALNSVFEPTNPTGYAPVDVVMRNAVNPDGLQGSFGDTTLVPYFVWTRRTDGTPLAITNCGLLLDYFNHGRAGKDALALAVAQIEGDIKNAVV